MKRLGLCLVMLALLIIVPFLPGRALSQTPACSATQCPETVSFSFAAPLCSGTPTPVMAFTSSFGLQPDTSCPYPTFYYVQNGTDEQIALLTTPKTIWIDKGTIASAQYLISDPAGDNYQANESTQWTITRANQIRGPSYSYVSFTEQQPEITRLYCNWKAINIYSGSLWWADDEEIGTTYWKLTNFSQTPTGPGFTFGVGCDPYAPAIDFTIKQVSGQGVLLTMDGTSMSGDIYGIFYYGYLSVPTETTFSEEPPIQNTSYYHSYLAFRTALGPAVYVNSTSGYVEWKLPATLNPQSVEFSNATQFPQPAPPWWKTLWSSVVFWLFVVIAGAVTIIGFVWTVQERRMAKQSVNPPKSENESEKGNQSRQNSK